MDEILDEWGEADSQHGCKTAEDRDIAVGINSATIYILNARAKSTYIPFVSQRRSKQPRTPRLALSNDLKLSRGRDAVLNQDHFSCPRARLTGIRSKPLEITLRKEITVLRDRRDQFG